MVAMRFIKKQFGGCTLYFKVFFKALIKMYVHVKT